MIGTIIGLLSGALGGNVAGALMKNASMGTLWNSVVGILGGGIGSSILGMLGIGAASGAAAIVLPDDENGKISASAYHITQGYTGNGVLFRFKFEVKSSNPPEPAVQINNSWGLVQANRVGGEEQPIDPQPREASIGSGSFFALGL